VIGRGWCNGCCYNHVRCQNKPKKAGLAGKWKHPGDWAEAGNDVIAGVAADQSLQVAGQYGLTGKYGGCRVGRDDTNGTTSRRDINLADKAAAVLAKRCRESYWIVLVDTTEDD